MMRTFPLNTPTENLPPSDDTVLVSEGQGYSQPVSTAHKIFFGADGLRAGWSLLLFLAMFATLLYAANFVAHTISPGKAHHAASGDVSAKFLLGNELVPFVAVFLVTWIMSKIEGRHLSVYGLGGRSKVPHFFAGLAWGVSCLSLLVFTLWKLGFLVIDKRVLFGGDILRYGAVWFVGFLLVGLLEEYLTRGYLQYTLSRGLAGISRWALKSHYSTVLAFWISAAVFSFVFGFGHGSNPGESPIGMLSAGLIGLVFCLSLWRTGSLWWAIGFHAAWDWAQSFLYGVADSGTMIEHHLLATHPLGRPLLSGGATGPEGSILILAVVVLVTLIILVTLPQTQERL
jgi:membrane protease YdiL (CAAX protease family)